MKLKPAILTILPVLLLALWWGVEPSRPLAIQPTGETPEVTPVSPEAQPPSQLATKTADPSSARETVWQLSDATVVSAGQTMNVPEGVLSSGHTLEAVATNPADGTQGKVQIVITAFRPSQDMPGQKAGRWYLSGDWRFFGEAAQAVNLPVGRNGHLRAELDFNPAETPGQMAVQLWTSRLRSGPRPTRVAGTFVGNQKFEGQLRFGGPAQSKSLIKPNA